jgi:hypothetical protein
MTTYPIADHKPFMSAPDMSWARRVSWGWWLKRAPMLLLAAPSAYGVGAFAHEHLPIAVAVLAGCAFEAAYIGAVAMADQQHDDDDTTTTLLWWVVNLFAVIASVLSNLLFFSGGTYAAITPEVATHAIPLPVLGFAYGLLLHRTATKAARAAEEAAQYDVNRCPYCDQGFKSDAAKRGHMGRCTKRPAA